MELSNTRLGEIVLLSFPYSNYKGSKLRPAVIVSHSEYFDDFLVAFITSETENYIWSKFAVVFKSIDLQYGQVAQESLIRCDKIITVDKSNFGKENVAKLNKEKQKELVQKFSQIAGLK